MTDKKTNKKGFGYNYLPYGQLANNTLTITTYDNPNMLDDVRSTFELYSKTAGAYVYVSSPHYYFEPPIKLPMRLIAKINGRAEISGICATAEQRELAKKELQRYNMPNWREREGFLFMNNAFKMIAVEQTTWILIFEVGDSYFLQIVKNPSREFD